MRSRYGAQRGDSRKQKQKIMKTTYAAEVDGWILQRSRFKLCAQEWFDYQEHEHEDEPEAEHSRHPPIVWISEPILKVQPVRHPKTCRTRERNGDANLRRKASLHAFEQREGLLRRPTRSSERQ